MPDAGDAWDWTREYSILFRAYEIPCWENNTAITAATGPVTAGSVNIEVPGSLQTVANVTLKNESGATINTATVTAGSSGMSFSALGIAADESLVIDHTAAGYLRIRILSAEGNYRSVLEKRSESSADDLAISPGSVEISFTAQRACQMTASVRGRFA